MSTLLAAPYIARGLQSLAMILGSQLERDRMHEETLRIKALETLRSETEQQKISAQKEVILAIIEAGQYVFDRKYEAMISSYNSMMELINKHQEALLEDERNIANQLMEEDDDNRYARLMARQTDVRKQLMDIQHEAQKVYKDMNALLTVLELDLSIITPKKFMHIE